MKHGRLFSNSIRRFLLAIILISIINLILIASIVLHTNKKQDALSIVNTICNGISQNENTYHVTSSSLETIHQHHLWIMIVDKHTGKETYQINKPADIQASFDYGDILKLSRFYLNDYPIFSQIKDNNIILIAFPKNQTVRYTNNYLDIPKVK